MHGCSDGFEKMRRCEGSSKKLLKAASMFFLSLSRLCFKTSDECTGVSWAVEGLVTVATLLLFFPSLQILSSSSSFTYSI